MRTYRQNLNLWLEEKKDNSTNDEVKNILSEIQKHIKNIEKDEERMVNDAYYNGYHDRDLNRGVKNNYYRQTYKIHDKLKQLINLN